MASKRYTNADLKPEGGPTTTYGPWKTTGRPRVNPALEELLEEGESVESILASAKDAVRRTAPQQAVLSDINRRVFGDPAAAVEQASLASPVRQFVRGVRESPVSQGALMAGSVIPSPVQPVFGGALALDALTNAIEEPGAMSALNAGLMALPAGRVAQKALRGRSAAKEAGRVAEGLYRGTGLRRGKNIPYQYPAGKPAPVSSMDVLMQKEAPALDVVSGTATTARELPFKPSGPRAPSLPREQRAAWDEAIDLGEITPQTMRAPTRVPLGARSRPSTQEFGQELQSIDNLSEQDIQELLDAIAWARR